MSVVATALVLGLLVLLLVKVRQVGFAVALVCVVFGFVLGTTPAGPTVGSAVNATGDWIWTQLEAL